MQTDENGIAFIETTDAVSPLTGLINPLMQSVSDKVNELQPISNDGVSGVMVGATPPEGTPLIEKHFYGQVPTNTNTSGISTISYPGGAFPNGVVNATVSLSRTAGGQSAYNVQTGAATLSAIDIVVAILSAGNFQFASGVRPSISLTVRGW